MIPTPAVTAAQHTCIRTSWRWPRPAWRLACLVGVLAGMCSLPVSGADEAPRVTFPDSVANVASAPSAAPSRARIVRAALAAAETESSLQVEIVLRMRNFAELQSRIHQGELIPRAEMAAKYLPLPADYEALRAWLTARGLTVAADDASHLSVFVRGTVSQLKALFGVDFARVATADGEFTSAVSTPSVPIGLAAPLLGINGLQPHVRPHKMATGLSVTKASRTTANAPPYLSAELRQQYGATATGLTGAGQTIAIVIDTFPLDSDLATYWANCNVTRSPTAAIEKILVAGTPAPPNPATLDASGVPIGTEAVIDAELTSSMAPAATIRIYATGQLDTNYLSQAYSQLYSDLPTQPNLHQLNLSFGLSEAIAPASYLQADAQRFATLTSAGVTVFASSGDGGSNPANGRYSATAIAAPSYPASDPNVTGVGATTLRILQGTEVGWDLITTNGQAASGGGASAAFTRPAWQSGTGITGTARLVPDVSIVGDPATGAYIVNVGSDSTLWGGTSISSPIWAGFGALINQARASAGLSPVGLLGPKIYPLIGTSSFRDITSGNNGLFTAGVGFDQVTGIGTPVMTSLVPTLSASSAPPAITAQPASKTVAPGQNAAFALTASGGALTYQWQRQAAGTITWTNLADTATYTGSTTASVTVNSTTIAMNGDSFRCVVSNPNGSVTSSAAMLLVVDQLAITTLAGSALTPGSADGTGTAARFNHPSDLVVDAAGTAYVTDTENHTIRKVAPGGVVTTLAGLAGATGSADGTGSAARFHSPTGITRDPAGNLYVADTDNRSIRKVTTAGVVTTIATGFSAPSDVVADNAGNVYVADAGDHTIRRVIVATGATSLVAGQAGNPGMNDTTPARFNTPEGVGLDATGNLYVADTGNHTIRKIVLPTGAISTFAGQAGISGSGDGFGTAARFQAPSDLAVSASGMIFVADTDNHVIREITANGYVGTVAGQAGVSGSSDGTGGAARLFYPAGVAVDQAGIVYIADTNNNTIRWNSSSAAPTITGQPVSQSVLVGGVASFSVTATGTPAPTYQWNFNGTAIAGATSSTYTISGAQSSNAGNYTVTVSNAVGSVTSAAAALTVNAATPPADTSGGGGGGGGGGALELWFAAAFAALGAARWLRVRRAS